MLGSLSAWASLFIALVSFPCHTFLLSVCFQVAFPSSTNVLLLICCGLETRYPELAEMLPSLKGLLSPCSLIKCSTPHTHSTTPFPSLIFFSWHISQSDDVLGVVMFCGLLSLLAYKCQECRVSVGLVYLCIEPLKQA